MEQNKEYNSIAIQMLTGIKTAVGSDLLNSNIVSYADNPREKNSPLAVKITMKEAIDLCMAYIIALEDILISRTSE